MSAQTLTERHKLLEKLQRLVVCWRYRRYPDIADKVLFPIDVSTDGGQCLWISISR